MVWLIVWWLGLYSELLLLLTLVTQLLLLLVVVIVLNSGFSCVIVDKSTGLIIVFRLAGFWEKFSATLVVACFTTLEVNMRVASLFSESLLALLQIIDFLVVLFADFTAVEFLEPVDKRTLRIIPQQLDWWMDTRGGYKPFFSSLFVAWMNLMNLLFGLARNFIDLIDALELFYRI